MYNVEKYIEKCIISTQNQDIPTSEYEVVCVNDGSPDNSLSIAENLTSKYENIKVITRPNGGLSAARNTGIDNAKGEYIFFLDSDDWITENCLGAIVDKLNNERPDVLAICAANIFDKGIKRRASYPNETPITGIRHLLNGVEFCAPFGIWRKLFLEENRLRFVEGIYHEDAEFTPRAYYMAKKVSRLNTLVYNVFQSPNSITRSINPQKGFDCIGSVCVSLHNFYNNDIEKNDSHIKHLFDDMISLLFNNGLYNCRLADKKTVDKLNNLVFKNIYLTEHLYRASSVKYRVEAALLSLFPHKAMQLYKFMKLIQ